MAAASVPTILKHYVVPVMPHAQTSGLFWWRKSQRVFYVQFRKVWFFPAKPMQKNIYFQMTCLCALHTALMWDDSTLGGAADLFVLD